MATDITMKIERYYFTFHGEHFGLMSMIHGDSNSWFVLCFKRLEDPRKRGSCGRRVAGRCFELDLLPYPSKVRENRERAIDLMARPGEQTSNFLLETLAHWSAYLEQRTRIQYLPV
jgi:hypothetical protein